MSIQCILFDLDGTLMDTSLDFAYALNQTLSRAGKPPLPYDQIRQTVSSGGLAMTQLAFPELKGDALLTKRDEFIQIYQQNIAQHTQLFPTLASGLGILEKKQIPWGIVTNKPTYLTEQLLAQCPLSPKVVICGDTLPQKKPDPAPMLLAAEQCQVEPEHCLYLGDHPRDIEAGKNANMKTGAALFGFIPQDCHFPNAMEVLMNADYVFHTPLEITHFFQQAFE